MNQERERIKRLVEDVLGGVSTPKKRFDVLVAICFLIMVFVVSLMVFQPQLQPRCDQMVNHRELEHLSIVLSKASDIEALKIKDEILNLLNCK